MISVNVNERDKIKRPLCTVFVQVLSIAPFTSSSAKFLC